MYPLLQTLRLSELLQTLRLSELLQTLCLSEAILKDYKRYVSTELLQTLRLYRVTTNVVPLRGYFE
ncbi:hypothetical protein FHS57_000024 [Runella defluvii]|uniref:Uncharacterized protein n=1 Tax=Runella defluvii TaxID=370973 RepID=A0A7W6EN81_9BACT|nr:hypothetical protein [Runella defluvii]